MNNKEYPMAYKGDIVKCKGESVTISEILYQDIDGYWDIEFIDTKGIYRRWKQYYDGGELISLKK